MSQHGDRPGLDDLDADDRAHERGLAAAVGAEQPSYGAAGHPEPDVPDHPTSPSDDPQAVHHDRRLVHGRLLPAPASCRGGTSVRGTGPFRQVPPVPVPGDFRPRRTYGRSVMT